MTQSTWHYVVSPFPRRLPDGRVIVDEKCRCGHLRSEHNDTLLNYGHGSLPGVCDQFSWINFVMEQSKKGSHHG